MAAAGVNVARAPMGSEQPSAPPGAVKGASLAYRLAWSRKLSLNADSSPVIMRNLLFPHHLRRSVVFVLAGNNGNNCDPGNPVKGATTYAFNAGNGKLLWKRSTGGPGRCTTSSPVTAGSWVYGAGLDGRIHKYRGTDGSEFKKAGWPIRVTLNPSDEKISAALTISHQYLYATTSGFIGDAGHYEGHIATINLNTNRLTVWNSLCSNIHKLLSPNTGAANYCSDVRAGLFGRGQGVIDPLNKDVFVASGNGPWNGTTNWGDSLLKLSPDGSRLVDAFTPMNQQYLNDSDSDLGSTGPAILPPVRLGGKTYHLLVQGGKGPSGSTSGPAVLYLLNRDRLGGRPGPGHLGGAWQTIYSPGGCEVLTAPAVWQDSSHQVWVFYANDCGVTGYSLKPTRVKRPKLIGRWHMSGGHSTPVIAGNRLYLATSGSLQILNPSSGKSAWSSDTAGSGGSIGGIHWEYPLVSGRDIFITDESGRLYKYVQR
jgi:hypothetical protein